LAGLIDSPGHVRPKADERSHSGTVAVEVQRPVGSQANRGGSRGVVGGLAIQSGAAV
jgi:hypothetical protein